MHLAEPRLTIGPHRAVLTCAVTVGDEEREWWIGVPNDVAGWIDTSVAPFLPTAVMVAAAGGEDVSFEGVVTPEQVAGAVDAVRTVAGWWGWHVPRLAGTTVPPTRPVGQLDGLLFSRGIDSMATLVDRLERDAAADTVLITVDDMEPLDSSDVAAAVTAGTAAVGDLLGLPVVVVSTNLRSESDRAERWDRLHPMTYLGCGLALGPALRSLTLASGVAADDLTEFGTRSDLDPLWSTACTEVRSGLVGTSRADKAQIIARRPDLARHVKLCWQSGVAGNCGRCSKCQHSMAAFAAAGAASLLPDIFDHPLTAAGVRRRTRYATPPLTETAAALPDGSDLRESLEEVVDRAADGTAVGLAGLAPHRRPTADGDGPVGWGPGARAIAAADDVHHMLCRSGADLERPLPWVVADRVGPGSSHLALHLAERWPGGAVLLVDAEQHDVPFAEPLVAPGPPRSAVRTLLDAATVRVWWSDAAHLDGVNLLEAVEHGCAPLQVMPPDLAAALRDELPADARGLVRSLVDLERPLDADEVGALRTAAVTLATTAVVPTAEAER